MDSASTLDVQVKTKDKKVKDVVSEGGAHAIDENVSTVNVDLLNLP